MLKRADTDGSIQDREKQKFLLFVPAADMDQVVGGGGHVWNLSIIQIICVWKNDEWGKAKKMWYKLSDQTHPIKIQACNLN